MAFERKTDAPPKIDQKCQLSNNRNLMCYFNSGKGLIDLNVSLDIKLILKVFEIQCK